MNKTTGSMLLLLAIGITCPLTASAIESGKQGTLSFVLKNDLFYGNDRHYTNGVRMVWVPGPDTSTPGWAIKLARLVPWFPEQGEIRHGYAFGQRMFTPDDIEIADPPLGERPYAGWYLFAGVEGRAVAHNIFLDSNTFRDSRSVDKEPLIDDLQFGLVLDWPAARLSYTHVLRSDEFKTQKSKDDFGAFSVSIKF